MARSDGSSERDRDRVLADTGWGIKPDDQPANADEAGARALRAYRYDPNEPDVVRRILLAQRQGFNTANRVRVDRTATAIIDINGDEFLVHGLSFGDENLIALLERLGAAFSPPDVRRMRPETDAPRDFSLSRAWAWGAERSGG